MAEGEGAGEGGRTRLFVERLDSADPVAARLGGKGASLVRLVALGHRVPPGFVVTVGALEATLEHLGLAAAREAVSRALASGGDLRAGETLRRGLEAGGLPERVLSKIVNQVDDLGLWAGHAAGLIVRSSATVEDSAAHSFAGIFESIAIERPDKLEPAIREVWASLFSPRALGYARECGLRTVPAMAVVVQRFVEAERSGVMFTTFEGPDGRPRTLIEHVEGGCEKLVKGEVTPERLWLERGEVVADDLEGLLAPSHARELVHLAASLERSLGAPQDVEWCIEGGAVHVVQARPVTATFAAGADAAGPADGADVILSGVGASPGVGSGPVYLVFNIDQALALAADQVLVTPMTNPDMVVAMRNSSGIVTDVGGMICHAAIVSRELGLPCVVGTETATSTLSGGDLVTVDGSRGAVYRGAIAIERPAEALRAAGWDDLWATWAAAVRGHADVVPVVSSSEALTAMPAGIAELVLIPDVDLRADRFGLWRDLEGLPGEERAAALDGYVTALSRLAAGKGLAAVHVLAVGTLSRDELGSAIDRAADRRLRLHDEAEGSPPVVAAPGFPVPDGRVAVPLGAAVRAEAGPERPRIALPAMDEAVAAEVDTLRFFGHLPGVRVAPMPDADSRRRWWARLPEYARYHQEHGTERESREGREYEWLEVRPELVISALLKSLVQPGFEMVPRILGFDGLPPMHVTWIRCRYHFRADTFARTWEAIVRATWDEASMAGLMRRVRASYEALRQVLVLFPRTDEELAAISGEGIVALITAWWPRWVEFFALCWFIQAQGDDVLYPFVAETVETNLAGIESPGGDHEGAGFRWPPVTDLIAPTTPVMSGAYMASVGALREALVGAGLADADGAAAAIDRGDHPGLAAQLERHIGEWGWMRDRDLLFEPWDTPRRVIETALRTEPHAAPDYAANLRRNVLALSFHMDLAHASGRAGGLLHAARFLHDLNVERENHHVLWLKYSYPLRRLVLEVERRLVRAGSLTPGDVFFLQAPELIDAAAALPAPLPDEVAALARNRRAGYLREARMAGGDAADVSDENDYY